MQQSRSGSSTSPAHVTPLANILETADGYVLEAEMPGVAKDGIEVLVENGQLTVIGHRSKGDPSRPVLYRESRGLDYWRVFELDASIDAAHIKARMDQGILRVTLPKSEAVKPRKIEVSE